MGVAKITTMWWEYLRQNVVVKNIQLGGNIPQIKCKIYIKISVLANAIIVHKELSFKLLDNKYSASGKQIKLITLDMHNFKIP